VLTAIDELLAEHGSDLGQVVRVDIHITDIALKPAMDAAYSKFFRTGFEPARTTVAVTGLYGGCLVEITTIAYSRA
jgi:enamine deaminase RidA (YjgF/YER057c/UK114 family)